MTGTLTDVNSFFTGSAPGQAPAQRDGFPSVIVGFRWEKMLDQAGRPILNDGEQAYTMTMYRTGKDNAIYRTSLGNVRNKEGNITLGTRPGHFFDRLMATMREAGFDVDHLAPTDKEGSPEQQIADAATRTFAGLKIVIKTEDLYIPYGDVEWKKYPVVTAVEGRVDEEQLGLLQQAAAREAKKYV